MKIIGTTKDGFLCEVSASEISRIANDDSFMQFSYRNARDAVTVVGTTLDVAARWNQINLMERNREQLDKAIRQIRAVADVLEPCLPILAMPELPPESMVGMG